LNVTTFEIPVERWGILALKALIWKYIYPLPWYSRGGLLSDPPTFVWRIWKRLLTIPFLGSPSGTLLHVESAR
jgi:hypothetical protein